MSACRAALAVVLLIAAGCASSATRSAHAPTRAPAEALAVGKPLAPLPTEVMGIPGTRELVVHDPARPSAPPVFVTLGRKVPREPRDVCFGSYVANESPEDGDVICQVRGSEPLILTLSDAFIPHSVPVLTFMTIWGQASADVIGVQLLGPGGARTPLPLSVHRMFLVAFSPAAPGTYRLSARLTDGTAFTHVFELPLTRGELGGWPRITRRGAVFSDAPIGENIVSKSYAEIINELGPPLETITRPDGVRCIYYDIVGYENGWLFCFRGEQMVGAAGNQAPPSSGRGPKAGRSRTGGG